MNSFVALFICTLLFGHFINAEISFQIVEESPVETVIGNLFRKFPRTSQNDQLNILNSRDKAVNCFKINEAGDLLVARRIDRDSICKKSVPDPTFISKSETPATDDCKITLQVASPTSNMIVPVTVTIDDINDNAPTWSFDRLDLKFIDGCKERTKMPLPSAQDLDIGPNAHIDYIIKERDHPFRINSVDGLYLETLHSLDREFKDSYKLTIVASDKGQPARSSEIDVIVTVEDINDNNPTFTKTIYQFKSVSETSPIGTVIGKLEATDADSGMNGKFHFRFSSSVPEIVKHYFAVHPDGTVSITSRLDCDSGESQYKFKVMVEDEALRPYSRSSEATVVVTINDVNDESPVLKTVFMNRDLRSNNPFVVEHSKIGTLIGILEVRDADFKGNDIVTCRDPPFFSLLHEDRQSKYKIVTNVEFDREKMAEVTLMIICQDGAGNMALTNQSIVIRDINDNVPVFTRSHYVLKIRENMPINTMLSEKVQAVDPDGDSVIQYFLMKDYELNFVIDKDSGVISSRMSFDREECENYTIKVIAIDATHGVANTGTGTVQVLILDENDNKPIFSRDYYSFHVSENNLPPTSIGTVEASDVDLTDQQNSMKYFLDNSPNSKNFQIDSRTGVIRALLSLDREKMTHYILPVSVEDGQNTMSPRHTATSTVTVIIDDMNDNAPKFILPNFTKSSFDVSIKETVGHKITYVLAEDPDQLENGRITYSIKFGNDQSLFSIDPTSGLLFLSDSLQSQTHNQRHFFSLTITACDAGKPRPSCTDFNNLRIIIKTGKDSLLQNTDSLIDTSSNVRPISAHQEAIMICLAVVFVILLIACVALLILMKYKPIRWCQRGQRTNSKDKRFEACANSQMLPTIDGTVTDKDIDDRVRNFSSENLTWHSEHLNPKMGKFSYHIDHTNRPDYQTLESLCLASTMRFSPQPRFVDPCLRIQTMLPGSQSTSFLSNHDLKMIGQHPANTNDVILSDGHNHIYQSVLEEDNALQQFYSKLNDSKKPGKYNNASHHNINPDKDTNKYANYSYNEASFV